jgi:hypothetical protein
MRPAELQVQQDSDDDEQADGEDVYVRRLRSRLGPQVITTVRGWIDSGAYPVQPNGKPPISSAIGVSQNDSASIRGKATRLEPIISGARSCARGPNRPYWCSLV